MAPACSFEIMTSLHQGAIFGFGIGINVCVTIKRGTLPDSYAGHDSRFSGEPSTRRIWPESDSYRSHVCDTYRTFCTHYKNTE